MDLDLCVNKTSCNKCDIVYILKEYVKPLLVLLNKDLANYGLHNDTKCLNTAILLIIFLTGMNNGKFIIDYCDSEKTTVRHRNKKDNNHEILGSMMASVASKNFKLRQIYYIMITDGHFKIKNSNATKYFPGHVFILEKMPFTPEPKYNLYQSYINQYTLKGHFDNMMGKIELSYESACDLLHKLSYILTKGVWDDLCVSYWKEFTNVNSTEFLGTITKDNMFLCYKKSSVKGCLQNIKSFTNNKLKLLRKFPEENKELISNMEMMLQDIENNSGNFI